MELILQAIGASAHDLWVGLALASLAFGFCAWLVRSNRALKEREAARRAKVEPERDWSWPPRPRPAIAESHPRAAERIVPDAGRRAA